MLPKIAGAFVLLGLSLTFGSPQEQKLSNSENSDTPAPAAKSRPRVRIAGFSVNAGYMRYPGYGYYGYPGRYGLYSPYFYDPFFYGMAFHPGYFYGFGYQASMGEVKVQSPDRDAWVYIDGALAGKADKLKTMWLEPGRYNLEVKSGTHTAAQRIYVLSGKTLKVTPDMLEQKQ